MAGLVSLFCLFDLFMVMLSIGLIVLWVLSLADVVQRQDWRFPGALRGEPNPNEKLIWLLVVLFAGPVGAIIYQFVVVKPSKWNPGNLHSL